MSMEPVETVQYVAIPPPPRLTSRLIRDTVAAFYLLSPKDLQGASRAARYTHPRQAAMYLARKLTGQSYPQIGIAFGDRDHTTAMHACRVVPKRMSINPDLAEDMNRIEAILTNKHAGEGI